MHANTLIAADENSFGKKKTAAVIADLYSVHHQTVHFICKTYAHFELEAAIFRKRRVKPLTEPKLTGEVKTKIIVLSCKRATSWKSSLDLRLLADKAVELGYIESISHESVNHV